MVCFCVLPPMPVSKLNLFKIQEHHCLKINVTFMRQHISKRNPIILYIRIFLSCLSKPQLSGPYLRALCIIQTWFFIISIFWKTIAFMQSYLYFLKLTVYFPHGLDLCLNSLFSLGNMYFLKIISCHQCTNVPSRYSTGLGPDSTN